MNNLVQKALTRHLSYKKMRSWYAGLVKPKPQQPPYSHIVQIGDPTLRTVSEKVPDNLINSSEINFLINQMKVVFNKYKCVGLSASQVGVPLRLIMFEFNEKHAKAFSEEEKKIKEIQIIPFTVSNEIIFYVEL